MLLVERGSEVYEELDECFGRELRPLNTNLGSMLPRCFGCGGRLLAAYGSFASPPGVIGRLYVVVWCARLGLPSRDCDAELLFPGPIEKAACR